LALNPGASATVGSLCHAAERRSVGLRDDESVFDALGNLGDFIGGIGVVITLIYLAVQIKHNTEQTRLNTAAETWSGILDAWEPLYYGENSNVFRRGLAGELDPGAPDFLLFTMMMTRTLGQFELSVYQARHGALDDALLAMHSRLIQTMVTSPGGRDWWDNAGTVLFGKDFVAHVARIIETPDARIPNLSEAGRVADQ
jgi:hypothetical protein